MKVIDFKLHSFVSRRSEALVYAKNFAAYCVSTFCSSAGSVAGSVAGTWSMQVCLSLGRDGLLVTFISMPGPFFFSISLAQTMKPDLPTSGSLGVWRSRFLVLQ